MYIFGFFSYPAMSWKMISKESKETCVVRTYDVNKHYKRYYAENMFDYTVQHFSTKKSDDIEIEKI